MKKVLMIVLIVLCLAGVGVLGYFIFRSKNIESVALEGQMQSLYFVNEATTPNFDDAKLVVTYKNGNIKKIDINSSNVKIDDFSTSLKTHGTMKITYKSQTIQQSYDVIESGLYYISKEDINTSSGTTNNFTKTSLDQAELMFYLSSNGIMQYYRKVNGLWRMDDGEYDNRFNYKIAGDTLVVNFVNERGTADSYNIKANYTESGELYLTSTSTISGATEGSYPSGERIKTFTNANKCYRTNAVISDVKLSTTTAGGIYDPAQNVFNFKKGTPFSNYEIFIQVDYTGAGGALIYKENSTEPLLSSVNVRLTEQMIVNGLNLTYAHDGFASIHYKNYVGSNNSLPQLKYHVYEQQ